METFPILQYKRLASGAIPQLTFTVLDVSGKQFFVYLSATLHIMVDAGGPRSVRKCHGVALADLGDTKGFGLEGKEDRLYAIQLSEGGTKERKSPLKGWGHKNSVS